MSVYGRNETRHGCSSVMKLLLRQMFGLVAEQQGVYTKSLYYCFKYLVDARPDVEELAKKIVYLAINPSSDVEEVKSIKYVAGETEELDFCGCKRSERPPFCDGTHSWAEF